MVLCDRVDAMSSPVQKMSHVGECGVINTQCCDVTLSGYYVINIVDTMSHIYWMRYHPYSGCDVIDRVVVKTQIEWT